MFASRHSSAEKDLSYADEESQEMDCICDINSYVTDVLRHFRQMDSG